MKQLRVSLFIGAALLAASFAHAAEEQTFLVQEGAHPWRDRTTGRNAWELIEVPESLKGTGPLPRQHCESRVLKVPGKPKSVTIGVSEKDLGRFKAKFPAAKETGEKIAVKNAKYKRVPYRVLTLSDPPEQIGEKGGFSAGLMLLKVEASEKPAEGAKEDAAPSEEKSSAATAPAASTQAAAVSLPAKDSFHIYLLMGQSNMVGRDTRPVAAQIDNPRVLALDGNDQWVVAREPMHAGGSGIGPGIPFANEMLKSEPDLTVGLVPCAVGGTSLGRWVKGADLYERAVSRAKAAAQAGVLKGVLWHQGESDTGKRKNAESYESRLTQMLADLRQDLAAPELPIVVGQLGDFLTPEKHAHVEIVRAAIRHIPEAVKQVGYADAAGLSHKGDKLHFSAEAEKELGTRYAKAIQQLQK